jgi:inositol hexakisphosphate/diphosphoinositol-pentakisphosphate kinase
MPLHLSIVKQNEEMKTDPGSIENLCPGKASDEPDRALQTSPQPVEGTGLPRRSPLIRNRKAGSMEVMTCTRP